MDVKSTNESRIVYVKIPLKSSDKGAVAACSSSGEEVQYYVGEMWRSPNSLNLFTKISYQALEVYWIGQAAVGSLHQNQEMP